MASKQLIEVEKITIEHPLSAKSPTIVWRMISTAAGLQKWIADYVMEDGQIMTFTWGELWTERDTKTSRVIAREKNHFIRLKWDDIEEDYAYWEMRLEKSEVTGHLVLVITDFASHDDLDYLKSLWSGNLERLHRVSGL